MSGARIVYGIGGVVVMAEAVGFGVMVIRDREWGWLPIPAMFAGIAAMFLAVALWGGI